MTESASGTFVRKPSDPPIFDQYDNAWALSLDNHVTVDGWHDPGLQNVSELVYLNRRFWAWTSDTRLWHSKAQFGATWSAGQVEAPFGPTPDPRIDQILTAIAAQAKQIATVRLDIETLPLPDPRIDDLATASGMAALIQVVVMNQSDILARLSRIEAALAPPKRSITVNLADMGVVGHQPIPAAPGP